MTREEKAQFLRWIQLSAGGIDIERLGEEHIIAPANYPESFCGYKSWAIECYRPDYETPNNHLWVYFTRTWWDYEVCDNCECGEEIPTAGDEDLLLVMKIPTYGLTKKKLLRKIYKELDEIAA